MTIDHRLLDPQDPLAPPQRGTRARPPSSSDAGTTRPPAEAVARASADRYRELFEHANDILYTLDLDGNLTDVNRQGEHLTGYTRAELIGTPIAALILPEDRDRMQQMLARKLTGEAVTVYEVTLQTKDGQRLQLEVSSRLIERDGVAVGVHGSARDITDRKRAEAVQRFLTEASHLFAASLDHATTLEQVAELAVPTLADWCLVDLVANGSVDQFDHVVAHHVDPAQRELLADLRRRYPTGRHAPAGYPKVIRTGRAELVTDVSDALLAATAQDTTQLAALRALGIRSTIYAPLVARGRVMGALTLATAESGRRYTPADLAVAEELARRAAVAIDNARLHRELQEQVATHIALNAALRETAAARDRALADLQETLRARYAFVAALSHDLKSPLTGIKGQAQLLARRVARAELGAVEAGWLREGLLRIDATATKMTALLSELVDLMRLQAGVALDLHREPTDLLGLVRTAVEQHQQTTDRHQLRLEADGDALVGNWDGLRLERVVANLLTNAIQYSPDGGTITITVGHAGEASADNWAVLTVQDEGLGIPAADIPHVFDWFRRGSNVVGRIAGTGIGLAGARQLVEQHGGTITVASMEGEGATFTVRLPL